MSIISLNLEAVRNRIRAAAQISGRNANNITLVAVTKNRTVAEIQELALCGVPVIGENRVQELVQKFEAIKEKFAIHFIGHLQTNKVRQVVPMVETIQSVDSLRLAEAIDKTCETAGKKMNILVEVNTSKEPSKYGLGANALIPFLKDVQKFKNIRVRGLMTMGPLTGDRERIRASFRLLAELKKKACLEGIDGAAIQDLSMGMSNDFEIAIEEGATMVRIGSAIFEKGE